MSSLLMQAAHSAAQADGLAPAGPTSQSHAPQQGKKNKGPPLRRGKWTPEEEAYANRLIQEFKAGLLPLTDGTTLRTFLSKLLNCDPMRISKKFVGSNCIGKQVFRRRTADLNRLTPEQIAQSRAELCELERRFLDRVAQTNRVKSSGVGGGAGVSVDPAQSSMGAPMNVGNNPAWMQPPQGYTQGTGAIFAASNQAGANSRAAAAGRALLGDLSRKNNNANMLAMAELQRRASQSSLLQNALNQNSAGNLLSAMQGGGSGGLSNAAMAQLAQSASAAGLGMNNSNSVNDLMMKTGLSRDQLSQFARSQGISNGSLSNMVQRQNSFDALMSLDMQQSFQSIDNLANLIQSHQSGMPEGGMQNANFDFGSSRNFSQSNEMSNAARRLASSGQMSSLLNSISHSNFNHGGGDGSNTNLQRFLQQEGSNSNIASLLSGHNQSAASFANLLRNESGTGLSALRMQDGQRNTSVDDFLSLMASGEIPHQDASVLNVPLMQQQQSSSNDTARFLAQQAQNNPALANALAARRAMEGDQSGKRKIGDVGGQMNAQGNLKK